MNASLDTYRLKDPSSAEDLSSTIQGPRHFQVQALYASPLAIAAHLSPDRARFALEDAKADLLRWLSALDQTARVADVAGPVVACLEISDPTVRAAITGWEAEARWCGSGHVLYIRESGDDARKCLERLLFKTVDEAMVDRESVDVSISKQLSKIDEENLPEQARSLFRAIKKLVEQRAAGGGRSDLTMDIHALALKFWEQRAGAGDLGTSGTPTAPSDTALPGRRRFIERVHKVNLSNFRGWCGTNEHEIDVDADLVLLTGANGQGKSSLLQAVMLALTGDGVDSPDDMRPRQALHANGRTSVKLSTSGDGTVDLRLPDRDASRPNGDDEAPSADIPLPELPRSSLWHDFFRALRNPQAASEAELNISAVFSDKLGKRFEDKRSADNLVNVFSDAGIQLTAIRDTLEGVQIGVDKKIQERRARVAHLRDEHQDGETRQRVVDAFHGARPVYEQLAALYPSYEEGRALPPWLGLSEPSTTQLGQALQFLDELAQALGVTRTELKDAVNRSIDIWKAKERRETSAREEQAIEKLEHARADLLRRYPEARARVEPFASSDGGPPLDVCLDALSRNLERWRRASREAGLDDVAAQLHRVIPDDLHRLAARTRGYLEERRVASERGAAIDAEVERLRLQAKKSERLEQLESIARDPELKQLWRSVKERREFDVGVEAAKKLEEENGRNVAFRDGLGELVDSVGRQALDPSIRKAFEDVLLDILERIHITEGILPIRIEASGEVLMKDGRRIQDLSTGQKTQLAVALSVGINLALGSRISTGIIAMDDVSAAYDASNIAREALLWRAVAYGHVARRNRSDPSDPPDPQRRQLFLSSHNETTTRRLVELLRPPPGATMKIVRFKGWTPEHGPVVQVDEVRCTGAKDATARERLAREIQLTPGLGRNR
ncbi:hypothetical protein predicted by Glimmer/Critica [Sorangium cellulosum So ce56]|uniref:Rad50/SbcC-type AAA domain-containing protein n=1 Tax=Sorangium cellulosum (strain So ce56) TaxID=448385 RepID=A9G7D3_SORC5|nr:ATP-binding protein [Sorangium cellulosum]CAN95841.1 hypothetical protein predicted by Glimmer/Critica [Sorangium cellulosum So ce56]